MSRVLVVDDEPAYRAELEVALSRAGHEVQSAATARAAIDRALRRPPDVLVVDWMLRDSVHGLHVVEALRAVQSTLRTVLITGFGSPDLRAEAAELCIFDFLEKPFGVDRIQQAVAEAAASSASPADFFVGILHVDTTGVIVDANARARALLAATRAGADAARLDAVFSAEAIRNLDAADSRWVHVSPLALSPVAWHMRARRWPDDGCLFFVVLPGDERDRKHSHVVRLLLDLADHRPARWPLAGHALILDGSALVRRVVVAELEAAGCLCHAAADADNVLRLLTRDPEIEVMIVDWATPSDTRVLVERAYALRPDLRIVGTDAEDHRDEFAVLGVHFFLFKPYVVENLVNLLTDRIGACVDCGLPIPLRRVRPGETGRSWECAGCGARYYAVFDEGCAADSFRNVRPAEPPRAPPPGG